MIFLRWLFPACLLGLSWTGLFAQPGYEDVVYLKNGSVIRGVIIEHIISERIKIEIAGGSVFVFRYDEIEKMAKENARADVIEDSEKKPAKPLDPAENGIFGTLNWGLNTGENTGVSLLFSMSYLMKYHYGIGFGMGVESFNRAYFPLYLQFNYRPLKALSGPYAYTLFGYSAPGTDNNRDYKGGIMGEAGLGLYTAMSANTIFTFSVGFRYQESAFEYGYYYLNGSQDVSGKDYYRRIPVRLGLIIQ